MSGKSAEEIAEHKRLAIALAPEVAIALRPLVRTDIWQAAIVCSLVIWGIGYVFVIAKIVDRQAANQVNLMNVEIPPGQEDLQREILQHQGHIAKDGDK